MSIKPLFLILFSFLTFSISAQSVSFVAKTDANKILEGSYVDVDFVLSNGDGSNFKPPSFNNFEVVGGPNRSSSMTIVNGNVSKTLTYGYTLRPKSIGNFQIGSASIRTKSGLLKTKPVTVQVIKGSNNPQKREENFFIETSINDTLAYVGQQLILEYKLFTTEEVRSVNFMNDPEFDGFFVRPLNGNSQPTRREIINGVEYATKVIKKIALFPQQTGTYEINPVTIQLGIADKNRRSRGFFFSSQLIEKRTLAPGKTIVVANTPQQGKDGSFSGAIGRYSMSAKTSKRSLTTDEAIVVNMTVQGNGDSKTVSAPMWTLSDSLEIYDPNILEDETMQNNNQYIHKKSFEYLIVPKFPGRYKINPKFTYFDTDKKEYVTIRKSLPTFNVLKGSQLNTSLASEDKLDIKPFSQDYSLSESRNKIHGTPIYWGFILLLCTSIAGVFLYNNHLNKTGQRDPALIRRNKALSIAQKRLEDAKSFMDNGNTSKFYEELSVAVKKFITDKYNISALHINKSEIVNQLKETGISQNNLDIFGHILGESEKAIYAPSLAAEMTQIYQQTVELFAQIDS